MWELNMIKKVLILLIILFLGIIINNCKYNTNNIHFDDSISLNEIYVNRRVEREIDGKTEHAYYVQLKANQHFNFTLEQNGINVAIKVISPTNESMLTYDAQLGVKGVEPFSFVSNVSGKYTLKVVPTYKTAVKGKYSFIFSDLRTAKKEDNIQFEGIELFCKGKENIETQKQDESSLKQGIEDLQKAIKKFREVDDKWHMCISLNNIHNAYFFLGDMKASQNNVEEALSIAKSIGDEHLQAYALDGRGAIYQIQGKYTESTNLHNEALKISRKLDDNLKVAFLLNNLGVNYGNLGKFKDAKEYYIQSIELQKKYGSLEQVIIATYNMCLIYNKLGEYATCISKLSEFLKVEDELNPRIIAYIQYGLGVNYGSLGDMVRSQNYTELAMQNFEKSGDKLGKIKAISQVAFIHSQRGDNEKALRFYNLILENDGTDPYNRINTLNKLGYLYLSLDRNKEAYTTFIDALSLSTHLELQYQKSLAFLGLGRVEISIQKYAKANAHLDASIEIGRKLGLVPIEVEGEFYLGKLFLKQNKIEVAEQKIKMCMERSEEIRNITNLSEFKQLFSSQTRQYYDFYVEILVQKYVKTKEFRFLESAWNYIEKSRARTLTEVLKTNYLENGINSALLAQEADLGQQINAIIRYKVELLNKKHNPIQLSEVEKTLLRLKSEYEVVELEIKKNNVSDITIHATNLTVSEIQNLIDNESTILEYQFGTSKNFVFVISKQDFAYFEIASTEDAIAKAIDGLEINVHPSQDYRTAEERKVAYLKNSTFLRKTLIDVVPERLLKTRLVLVSDRATCALPWNILINAQNQPLIFDHEVVIIPSVKCLTLQRQFSEKPTAQGLVIADPVFDLSDERLAGLASARKIDSNYISTTHRVPFTQVEANNIKKMVPNVTVFSGFEATLEKIRNITEHYIFVQLGTHSAFNAEDPSLSFISLSMYDEKGHAINGCLTISEIMHLKLSTNLVVMSSCQTARGRSTGEGLIGFSWAFTAIKCPRLVVALWNIDDEFTSQLMSIFYKKMLVDKHTPSQALRATQQQLLKEEKWQDPYYWAAFTYQGDWEWYN